MFEENRRKDNERDNGGIWGDIDCFLYRSHRYWGNVGVDSWRWIAWKSHLMDGKSCMLGGENERDIP